ncbi:alpha-tocopherol transfer protein-like [Ischnura elegans]|uniref:alpha-tocopherol transfer protein-like n=1 Tax=Ischnura elegans TaxID=197161 RepID=UPI001ED869CE|nr:alpha-tocopherol transfer protein-like [Ischnura elegans]
MSGVEIQSSLSNGNDKKEASHDDDIRHLRDWLPKQPHLPPITNEQLSTFLHACYYSLERTKKTIDQYYTVRAAVPELFSGCNPKKPEIQKVFDSVNFVRVPEVTPKGGFRIYFASLQNFEPANFDFENSLKAFIMMTDVNLMHETQVPGYVLVLDATGVCLGHIPRISIPMLKKFLIYVQEAMPIRLKQIHVINAQAIVDKIYAIAKPFLKGEIIEIIQFHKPGNMDTFYDCVSKDILPKELGGKSKTIETLHSENKRKVEDSTDYLQALEKTAKADESKRPGQPKGHGEIFGMEGSFRKLTLD